MGMLRNLIERVRSGVKSTARERIRARQAEFSSRVCGSTASDAKMRRLLLFGGCQ